MAAHWAQSCSCSVGWFEMSKSFLLFVILRTYLSITLPIGRHSGNNPDDFQKSWTDPPYFVDPLEILNISCPMYNGKHERNLLCAVDVNDYGQLLPDMKIKDSI